MGEIVALLLCIGAFILWLANMFNRPQTYIPVDVTAPGKDLCRRFMALGNMTGKTTAEIIARVGTPNSISNMADGSVLLQWMATGYHMAILFNAQGRFERITTDYASFQ